MKTINDIYKIIDKEHIILEEVPFKNNFDGIYFKVPGLEPAIGINAKIVGNSKKYLSTLTEELGHHFTTIGDLTSECFTYSDKLIRSKKEFKARRWAANFLISDEELQLALQYPFTNISSLCDHFNVTEEIIQMKILTLSFDDIKLKNFKEEFKKHDIQYQSCNI